LTNSREWNYSESVKKKIRIRRNKILKPDNTLSALIAQRTLEMWENLHPWLKELGKK